MKFLNLELKLQLWTALNKIVCPQRNFKQTKPLQEKVVNTLERGNALNV